MKELSYLNTYLYKYRSYLIWGAVFVAVSNIFAIIPAQMVRHAFDLVSDNVHLYLAFKQSERARAQLYDVFANAVFTYGVVIVGMALLRGVFLYLTRQTIIVMSRLVEYDLKNDIYAHYQTLPLSFYRRNNTGDLMARISEDVGHVRMYLGPAIMYGLNMIITFVLIIGYMLTVNVQLTLWSLLPLPILSLSIYYVNNLINKHSEQIQRKLSEMSTFVQEAFSGIRVIKSFVRENDFSLQFAEKSKEYRIRSLKLAMVNALFYPLIMTLIGLSTIFTVYIGGIEVINGTITTGNIAEFVIYINLLTWPVTSLGWVTSIIQRAAASQKRINEFLNTQTDIVSTRNLEKEIVGNISFHNVSFRYPDSGIEALHKISFDIKAGESLAILGATGSGKTTIANLMCRLYDPTEGEILIDGEPIQAYNISYYRRQIGYVPQDVFLFSDTIANNIGFGLTHLAEADMIQAAKDADVYQNIMDFPQGFATEIGERGITLSGGQKQRVSIARAIVRNPRILILDDALSAVDTKTEHAILNNLQRIMQGRTTVIISHRVSSAKLADHIIVLHNGRIAESGTHESLLLQGGIYKELYEKQMKTEEEMAE
ncbi:MAG: ABC transporter ATP-binding protein [Cytophagales bacterium]|nr:ABC transporter ATP-binding protein/permease [Bernardetiaceae bacterium]MDW8206003.1 ABC transporter ATP-binding protein [Cytophagales bacterium]